MAAIPSLYLKWRAFREIVGHPESDRNIAGAIFGDDDAPVKFSKLLHGDLGCTIEIAAEIVRVINKRLGVYRASRSLTAERPYEFRSADLGLPVYTFTNRLIEAALTVDEDALARAHVGLLDEMVVQQPSGDAGLRLLIERFSTSRAFVGAQPSGGSGPLVFEAGKHKGQLAIIGASGPPVAAYTMFVRDPSPLGSRLWDFNWGETVLWLPSPSVPAFEDGRLLLMPDAQPLIPLAGLFTVTSVLAWDQKAIGKLDPRGLHPSPGVLDEEETSRFLTNLRRVVGDKQKKWQGSVTATSAEYIVQV
jgi:hypothetical protein